LKKNGGALIGEMEREINTGEKKKVK